MTLKWCGIGVGLFLATNLLILFHFSGGGMHTHMHKDDGTRTPEMSGQSLCPFLITSTQASLTLSPFFVSYSCCPLPTPATGAYLLGLPSNHLTTQIHYLLHLLLKLPFAIENKKRDPKSGSGPVNGLTTAGLGFCLHCQRNSERFLEAGSDYQELFERSPLCHFKEKESKSQRTLKLALCS